jgi:hypothetical protein
VNPIVAMEDACVVAEELRELRAVASGAAMVSHCSEGAQSVGTLFVVPIERKQLTQHPRSRVTKGFFRTNGSPRSEPDTS